MPPLHQGHPLFDIAKDELHRHGRRPDERLYIYSPDYDDAVMDLVLAALEGRDLGVALHEHSTALYYFRLFHLTGCDASWKMLNDMP